MNTRPPIENPSPTVVLSVAFNDDCSCFSAGLNTGFGIFQSPTCSLKTTRDFNAGVGLVQMMGKTNYLALVGGGRQPKFAQNKVILWDDSKGKVALEITALTAVRGVQLARNRIVVVLQNSVRVYSFSKPPNLISAYETADNLLGLCSMSEKMIAFPGRTSGQVQLVEIATGNVSIIPAHSSALRALRLSPDGELLATASDTGTLIRVWSTSSCARIAELRRGIDTAAIFSLGFSPSGTLLACTSDKSTLHIFDVPHPKKPARQQQHHLPAPTPTSSSLRNNSQQQQQYGGGGPPPPSSSPQGSDDGKGKWGILGKIPLMPRVFSDVYSFASAPFESGDEPLAGGGGGGDRLMMGADVATLGTLGRAPKGVVGWISEDSLLVVGAGKDARWEKFAITENEEGKRFCVREGWKRYLGGP